MKKLDDYFMMKYTLGDCLPKVFIEESEGFCSLHWSSNSDFDACDVLDEHRDYIEGFLDGCYKVFSINYKLPTRVWGHNSGSVSNIPKEVAEELETLIEELLQGLVEARYNNLSKGDAAS